MFDKVQEEKLLRTWGTRPGWGGRRESGRLWEGVTLTRQLKDEEEHPRRREQHVRRLHAGRAVKENEKSCGSRRYKGTSKTHSEVAK